MEEKRSILTESGTNELEIVQFTVGENLYGINVMKVREVLTPKKSTKIPHAHKHVRGMMQLRGDILPIIDLSKVLGVQAPPQEEEKWIVAEFNLQTYVFVVHQVQQIDQVSWEEMKKPSEVQRGVKNQVIGVIEREDHLVLLLDFEQIVTSIQMDNGMKFVDAKEGDRTQRGKIRLYVAEDSPLLQQLLLSTLQEAGYERVTMFENGAELIEQLESLGEHVSEHVDGVITDIEMPKMDGHHVTKRMKDHASLRALPVIIFSSLITEGLRHKGEAVGADAQVSKPEINKLVANLDRLFVNK